LDRRVTMPSDGPVTCATSSLTLSSLLTGLIEKGAEADLG
jgi:hypothetical protein